MFTSILSLIILKFGRVNFSQPFKKQIYPPLGKDFALLSGSTSFVFGSGSLAVNQVGKANKVSDRLFFTFAALWGYFILRDL